MRALALLVLAACSNHAPRNGPHRTVDVKHSAPRSVALGSEAITGHVVGSLVKDTGGGTWQDGVAAGGCHVVGSSSAGEPQVAAVGLGQAFRIAVVPGRYHVSFVDCAACPGLSAAPDHEAATDVDVAAAQAVGLDVYVGCSA